LNARMDRPVPGLSRMNMKTESMPLGRWFAGRPNMYPLAVSLVQQRQVQPVDSLDVNFHIGQL
jgi:hypothetical protein